MLTIVQVSVGRSTLLGTRRGQPVYSGIRKSPVSGDTVWVGPEGIVGDEQADTRVVSGKRVHGGLLKAVYAYPSEHFPHWATELGIEVGPATFGENLTVSGLTEGEVYIGDVFQCDGVVLRVTSSRRPCYKLGMLLGPKVPLMMNQNRRCGWYLAVVNPGWLPTTGTLRLVSRQSDALSVAAAFAAKIAADPIVPDLPERDA